MRIMQDTLAYKHANRRVIVLFQSDRASHSAELMFINSPFMHSLSPACKLSLVGFGGVLRSSIVLDLHIEPAGVVENDACGSSSCSCTLRLGLLGVALGSNTSAWRAHKLSTEQSRGALWK